MIRLSEDALIARYFAPLVGPGGLGLRDDAALVTPQAGHDLVVTKDLLVAGVHFFADDPPNMIARKALRVNLSDLAAKGARPSGFLLGLGLPTDWTGPWLAAFAGGFAEDAAAFTCPLLGGDTVATPGPLTVSVTAFGEVPAGRMVPRTGTRAGDALYTSGTIGDAALGLQIRRDEEADRPWIAAIDPNASAYLLARHRRPEPRIAFRDALLAHARAAMDVSDGFLGDLGKMLRLEGLSATIVANRVPRSHAAATALALAPAPLQTRLFETMLTGGDDYEILCAVPPEAVLAFEAAALVSGISVARLGTAITGDDPVKIVDAAQRPLRFERTRFEHFS